MFPSFFSLFLRLRDAGDNREVVGENRPAYRQLPVLEALCQETTPGENVLKNTDAPFGGRTTFEPFAKAFPIGELVRQLADVARAQAVANASLFQQGGVGFAGQTAISPDVAIDQLRGVNETFNGRFDQHSVARVALIGRVIDDDSFAGFAEPGFVAELDLRTGFASLDDVAPVVLEAEDLVSLGDAALADDAFMGLFDGGGKLVQDMLDAPDDEVRPGFG